MRLIVLIVFFAALNTFAGYKCATTSSATGYNNLLSGSDCSVPMNVSSLNAFSQRATQTLTQWCNTFTIYSNQNPASEIYIQSADVGTFLLADYAFRVYWTYHYCAKSQMAFLPDTICAQNGNMWALGINSMSNDTAFTQISTGYGTCASIGYKDWGGRDTTAKVDTLKNPKDWNQCTNPQGVLSQGTDANGRVMYTCGSWRCTGSFGASCFVSNATTQAVTSCECDGGCSTIDWSTCQGKFAPSSSASSSGSSSPSSSASSSGSSSPSSSASSSGSSSPSSSASSSGSSSGSESGTSSGDIGWLRDTLHNMHEEQIGQTSFLSPMKTDLDGIAQDVNAIKTSLQNQKNDTLALKDTSVDFSVNYAQNQSFGDSLTRFGNQLDSIKAAGMGATWGDSGAWNDGSNFGLSSGSMGDAKDQLTNYVNGLADSGAVGQYKDSLDGWIKKFDYAQLKGSGCPEALTRTTTVTFPMARNVSFAMPSLGQYLCEPIFGGLTGWNFCTTALRFVVVFGCFVWLFKVATGQDGGGESDD